MTPWQHRWLTVLASGAVLLASVSTGVQAQVTRATVHQSNVNSALHAGKTTLVVAAIRTPEGFDQEQVASLEAAEIQANLYDNLIRFGRKRLPNGVLVTDPSRVEGALASSWGLANGGRTVIFHLRHGVKSVNGHELTSADVKWTYDRGLILGRTSSFYLNSVLGIKPKNTRAIVARDKYTVEIHLPKRNALSIQLFTGDGLSIKDSVEAKKHVTTQDPWANNWLAKHDDGYGPYRVESWVPGSQIVLAARSDYYRGAPKIKRILYREIPQSSNRLALLEAGQVDLAEYLLPREVASIHQSGLKVINVPGNFVYRIEFQEKQSPFQNRALREALNYLAPRQQIIKGVFYGHATEARSYLPSSYPGFSAKAWDYSYNVAKAKQLLAQAGYSKGLNLTLQYDAGVDIQEQMAVLVRTAYQAAGVNVTLQKIPSSEYASKTFDRTLSFYFRVDSPWQADPVYAASLWLYSKSFTNYSSYNNPAANRIIDQMRSTLNRARRLALARRLQAMVLQDPPWVFLVQPAVQVPMRACLTGYTWYLTSLIRFDDLNGSRCSG